MQASTLVTLGIPSIALAVVAAVAFAIHRYSRPDRRRLYTLVYTSVIGGWLAITGGLAAVGFFADTDSAPPRPLLLLVPTIGLAIALATSRIGKELADRAPIVFLVGLHAFRLPLELVMHVAAREGTMPEQMTFTGLNFDILTGATAVVVAALVARNRAPRWLVAAWNTLGSVLLVAIGAIAIASLPTFHAFGSDPARVNTWVLHFPFVWLPAALVSVALFGHIVVWRRLAAGAPAGVALARERAVR
jgi:hypothetical protein